MCARGGGITADDGEEAVQRITAFRPTIVISDLVMSRMGGVELLRGLNAEGDDVTAVILTAQASRQNWWVADGPRGWNWAACLGGAIAMRGIYCACPNRKTLYLVVLC